MRSHRNHSRSTNLSLRLASYLMVTRVRHETVHHTHFPASRPPGWGANSRSTRCWMFGAVPRQALGAKVSTFRGAPERSRSRLGNRARRVAGADSRPRPPGHWHVTAVEGVEPGLGAAPVGAVSAARPDRHRLGGDAFAAPLPIVRLGKMSRFIRVDRRFRRASRTEAFVLSELAPKTRRLRNSPA